MTFWGIFAQYVIPLIFAAISVYIVPALKKKLTDANLQEYVRIGVYAAEQLYKAGNGQEKYEYVKLWVQGKFKVGDEELEKLIEAVVWEVKNIV